MEDFVTTLYLSVAGGHIELSVQFTAVGRSVEQLGLIDTSETNLGAEPGIRGKAPNNGRRRGGGISTYRFGKRKQLFNKLNFTSYYTIICTYGRN